MIAIRVHSSLTSSTMCVERRTTLFSPSSLNRFRNRPARRGRGQPSVRPRSSASIAEQGDGDAEALLHAARVAAQLLLADLPQVRLPQQHHVLLRASLADTLSSAKWSSSCSALTLG